MCRGVQHRLGSPVITRLPMQTTRMAGVPDQANAMKPCPVIPDRASFFARPGDQQEIQPGPMNLRQLQRTSPTPLM